MVSEWGPWSPCPVECDSSAYTERKRVVLRRPSNGGVWCPEKMTETKMCKCQGWTGTYWRQGLGSYFFTTGKPRIRSMLIRLQIYAMYRADAEITFQWSRKLIWLKRCSVRGFALSGSNRNGMGLPWTTNFWPGLAGLAGFAGSLTSFHFNRRTAFEDVILIWVPIFVTWYVVSVFI